MDNLFVNKVAESGIITIDLTTFMPEATETAVFDLKPFLFREMILREKDYREALKQQDWSVFRGKHTAICCSADAIIPVWAFMLAVSYLQPISLSIFYGSQEALQLHLLLERINQIDVAAYEEKRIVIKGCADVTVPEAAYVAVTAKLQPVVKSLMYGEPCSTVPVYKKQLQRS